MKLISCLVFISLTACSAGRHSLKETPDTSHYDPLFVEAQIAFNNGSIAKSQRLLNQVLNTYDGIFPEATILKARLSLREGNTQYAKNILRDQIKLVPHNSDLHESLASVYFFEKDYAKAREALRRAKGLGAPMYRVVYHLGLIAEQENYLENAKKYFNQVIKLNPDSSLAVLSANRLRAIDVHFSGD